MESEGLAGPASSEKLILLLLASFAPSLAPSTHSALHLLKRSRVAGVLLLRFVREALVLLSGATSSKLSTYKIKAQLKRVK